MMFSFGNKNKSRMGKSIALADANTLGGGMGSPGHSMFSSGIMNNSGRFSPVIDRLEDPSLVDEWMPRDVRQLNRLFRYLYLRDNIAGPTVDMMSTIPWSDWHLEGMEDSKEVAHIFEESVENFNPLETMPQISCEQLVVGRACVSCLYNPERKIFEHFIPQDPDWLEITPIPVKGFDPKIDVIPDANFRRFITSKDERDVRALQSIPDGLLRQLIKGGKIPLEPLNTIFAPRSTFTSDAVGTSIYTRILPFWAVEKALLNSTIIAARRRTRPIMHVTAGIDGTWEPEDYELDDITSLFMQADEDPSGAIVVTRNGIAVNEIKDPAAQWKLSDEYDFLVRGKLTALGVNEELMSGSMTFNNLDTALSFFMEKIKNHRTNLTNQVFHKKMFPVLAEANGLYRRSGASSQVWTKNKLITPKMYWHKDLKPKGDAEYLAMLRDLKDMGLPVGLSVLAAAGDMDIEKLIADSPKDLEYRKKLKAYREELKKLEGGGEDQGGDGGEFTMANFMDDMKLWDKKGSFLGVTKNDIKKVVAKFATSSNLQKVTKDVNEIDSRLSSCFDGDSMKIHAAKYLLSRWGLFDKKIVKSEAFVSNMVQHIAEANSGEKFDAKSFSEEISALNNYVSDKPKLSKAKAEQLARLVTKLHNKEMVKSSDLNFLSGVKV